MAAVNDDNTQARQRQQLGFTLRSKSAIDRPKSILKQSPLHPSSTNGSGSENLPTQEKFAKSRLRVSINLPDNEISLSRSGRIRFDEGEKEKEGGTASASASSSVNKSRILRGKTPVRSASSLPLRMENEEEKKYRSSRTVVEVLRELDADILGLQDVKAEEEMAMKPLSDLASALGMNYVFAESWAPEYGNAILSKWPIKKWKVQKIFDDSDFRFFFLSPPISLLAWLSGLSVRINLCINLCAFNFSLLFSNFVLFFFFCTSEYSLILFLFVTSL